MGDDVKTPEPDENLSPDDTEPGDDGTTSRRRLLLGAVGAAAAGAAAGSALFPQAADATNSSAILAGAGNTATLLTTLNDTFLAFDNNTYYGALEGTNISTTGPGLVGASTQHGPGLLGYSSFGSQLYLKPGFFTGAGAPTSNPHNAGEIYVDGFGTMFKCVSGGTPGTWVPMLSVVPIAPFRIIDSTGSAGAVPGPFAPSGSTTHSTSVLTGAHGIPSGALGVVGNLSIANASGLLNGYGYLTMFAFGASAPTTASLTSGAGSFATTNGVVLQFGSGKLSFIWQGGGPVPSVNVFFDATAYIM